MSTPFSADRGLVVVSAQVHGPKGSAAVRLALDTGATSTVLRTAILVWLGYDPAGEPERVRMTTGSGVEFVPRVVVDRLQSVGTERTRFPLIAHTLPPTASVDGLLGLDFLRERELHIDFRRGTIDLR